MYWCNLGEKTTIEGIRAEQTNKNEDGTPENLGFKNL